MAIVAFLVNPSRPEASELAKRAAAWLVERGHEALWIPDDISEAPAPRRHGQPPAPGHPPAIPAGRGTAQLDRADLAVSLGGDGTMLRTVALASDAGVPVLGVNLGHLGYLTEVEPSGLEAALGRFLAGRYTVEERMTLEVSADLASGEPHGTGAAEAAPPERLTYLALNEAVVEKTVPGHTIRVSASISGRPFVTYAADALLVATPTGSTAYNLSARGPILSPRLRALVVTPVSPHMLFDRPLVLDPGEWVRLELAGPRPGVLVVDGLTAELLEPGDAVVCRAGSHVARLVSFGERDFHAILRARFHLADR